MAWDGIDWQYITLDRSTHAANTIEYEHHKIHDGRHFTLSNTTQINSGANFDLGITTGAGSRFIHAVHLANSTAAAEVIVYEHTSFNLSSGTAVTPVNRNRNKLNTSDHVFAEGPTVTDVGSVLFRESFGARNFAGQVRSQNEFVLNSGLNYLFRIQSAGANNVVNGRIEWYEHTDKN